MIVKKAKVTFNKFDNRMEQYELRHEFEEMKKKNHLLEMRLAEISFELEKSNSRLERAYVELSELDDAKKEFLTIISHEVRTSLNGILGPLLMIQEDMIGSKYSNLFKILIESARRLQKFALTSLVITELKSGVRSLDNKKVNLYELINLIVRDIQSHTERKNIQIDICSLSKELEITGDVRLLEYCLKGILENAVIYSPEGGKVEIRSRKSYSTITCEFTDEGPGFSDSAMKNLFKLFRPGEQHIDQNLGLDLSLAKLVMDAHSGNIEVENREHKGARVGVVFQTESLQ